MARKSLDELGELQRAVMEAIWEKGEATVGEVRDRLARRKELAYTTVLSAMQKLEKAGWLKHCSKGRTYVYTATRSRAHEGARSLRRLLDAVFGGDPKALFQHLLEDEKLRKDDLAELRSLIEKRRKELG
jgi:BlaI family transcriptional regulator, penicillinase repressor